MLLTISTTHRPADDLGDLLRKHPGRFQSFELSFGRAHVYYPEVGAERCTACLLLDVDVVGGVRGYADVLDIIRDPAHVDHDQMLEWIGGAFDPEAFDPVAATKEMREGLPDWRSMR